MRHIGKLVGLSVIAAMFAVPTAANAGTEAASLVDGTISVSDTTCTWTNATASDTPPNPATIDRNTVNPPGGNLACSGGITVKLENNPTVTFNDGAGTATADAVQVTGTQSGVTCGYRATNVSLNRDGTTRSYSGSFTASKISGGFFCPRSASGTATVSFH